MKLIALACVFGMVACLSACQKDEGVGEGGDASSSATAQPAAGVDNAQAKAAPAQAAPPAPAVEPDPPNPRPEGENWVWTPELRVRIGQTLQVQYRMQTPNAGEAWIGLVPEYTTETDAASNGQTAVARGTTVDAPEAVLNLELTQTGRFRLRLFGGSADDAQLLAESPLLTVEQWPRGDRASATAPYLTIGPPEGLENIEVQRRYPVHIYFEIPPDYPDSAFICAVPVTVKSPRASDNLDAAEIYWYTEGKTNGYFTWNPDKEARFVYRLFPCDQPGCDYSAESEEFTIIPQ